MPDLSGTWDFRTLVPLERPEKPEEEETAPAASASRSPSPWNDHGSAVPKDRRGSLIVDPPDGRLPALRAGAERQFAAGDPPRDGHVRIRVGAYNADGPEDRGLSERCLQGFSTGPPIVPGFYNQNLRIVQTPHHVALLHEMNHDARIVRIGGRHVDAGLRFWMGDPIGHWEGDVLVIESVAFTSRIASFAPNPFVSLGTAESLRLTERLRLVDDDTLEMRYTVDDPATFERPFTVVLLMRRSADRIYEVACHEGNRPLRNILSIARELEVQSLEPGEEPPAAP